MRASCLRALSCLPRCTKILGGTLVGDETCAHRRLPQLLGSNVSIVSRTSSRPAQ